jgi:hypothetical protein
MDGFRRRRSTGNDWIDRSRIVDLTFCESKHCMMIVASERTRVTPE